MRPSSPAFTSNRRIPDLRSKNTKAVGRMVSDFDAGKVGSGECNRGLFARLTSPPSRQCNFSRKNFVVKTLLGGEAHRLRASYDDSVQLSAQPAQPAAHATSIPSPIAGVLAATPRKNQTARQPHASPPAASAQRARRVLYKATALAAHRSPAPASRPANPVPCPC